MNILANFAQQLQDVWKRSNNTYRAAFGAAVLFVVATIAGVGWWASRPQYIPLASNLNPSDAAAAYDRLTTQGIPAKMSFAGSTILVPEARWAAAKLAASDVLGENTETGGGDANSSIFIDPDTRRVRLHNEKERFLARSIERIKSVASAEVHLAQPQESAFTRDRKDPKASVMITTRGGGTLSPDQSASIAAMIAASVEGLLIENVTVTDSNGNTLYPNSQSLDGGWARHYQYRQQVESDLSSKAESLLASSLGLGRAMVRVTATLDFTEEQREETKYDPDGKVKTEETIDSTETKGSQPTAAGVAGAGSNLTGIGGNTGNAGSSMTQERIESKYEVSMVKNVVNQYGGGIVRLSVSALVDLPDAEAGADAAGKITLAKAEELIKTAVGFDTKRGDEITCQQSTLTGVATEVETLVDTLNRWDFYNNLVKNASLGVAAVVALILGLMLIRKLQPMGAIEVPVAESTRDSVMGELAKQAKDNPEIVSQIVNAWLNSPATVPMTAAESGTASGQVSQRRAA